MRNLNPKVDADMQFVAIDVETANHDMGSICQIGTAKFVGGQLVEEWSTLIDPEDYFARANISVHGIKPCMVIGQPKLPEISEHLRTITEEIICVCHTHFDRISISRAYLKYNLNPIETLWLDSSQVVRLTWDDLSCKGYGLANVCEKIGYKFKHHDALEDAKAAGYVLIAALQESQIDINTWKSLINESVNSERPLTVGSKRSFSLSGKIIQRDGNPGGDLFGEVIVFTGELGIPRNEAADLAASIGCQVDQGVTKRTTILVVGDQDVTKLSGHEKSSKHRKAEKLIIEGQLIRIIWETDFKALVQSVKSCIE